MTIGILGGGQLARMLALAGYPLGLRFRFLDPAQDACAFPPGEGINGKFNNQNNLDQLIDQAQCITYEFENVDVSGVEYIAKKKNVYPPVQALATKQDRLIEKQLFQQLGIPTAAFHNIETEADLAGVDESIGYPLVLKSRSLGYDGKGQTVVHHPENLLKSWEELGRVHVIAEQFIQFDREISIIAARSKTGETVVYPISENVHEQAILRVSTCRANDPMAPVAEQYITQLLNQFDYVGVLALELFQSGDTLYANEYAPRVHNTGHWTIEGAQTSQFENHLRAILGLPLGSTAPVGKCAMVNCIGNLPDFKTLAHIPGVRPHFYDKAILPGRKVGHISIQANSEDQLEKTLTQILNQKVYS